MFESYENKILVATKMITDPIFAGSVVYIFRHTEDSAFGAILNSDKIVGYVSVAEMGVKHTEESIKQKINALIEDMESGKVKNGVPINAGGPCKTPAPYFIHAYEEFVENNSDDEPPEFDLGIPNTFDAGNGYSDNNPMYVAEGLYFGTPATLAKIYEAGKLEENKFKVLVGHSAWGAGQLESEIDLGAWEVIEPEPEMYFDKKELKKLSVAAGGAKKKEKVLGIFQPTPDGFDPRWN